MLTLSNFEEPDILKTLCKSLIEDESWEVKNAAQALEQKKIICLQHSFRNQLMIIGK